MPESDTPTLPTARLAATLKTLGFRPSTRRPNVEEVVRTGMRRFRVRSSEPAMGTSVTVTVVSASSDRAEHAAGLAYDEMRRLIPLLNRHDGASALSALNDQGRLRGAPPELIEVVAASHRAAMLSGGAFDVTVAPLLDLLRARGASADDPELREAMTLVDLDALTVSGRSVALGKDGMRVTLDGIAKGYIVDRMAAVLSAARVDDWLIEAGGDIRVSGSPRRRAPWRIGVRDPARGSTFRAHLGLSDAAIASSGGYEDFFEQGRTAHHIVDSRTGRSPVGVVSATVLAPTAMLADVLATTAVLLELPRARALVEALPGCACLLLDSDGTTHASTRWRGATPTTSIPRPS